MANHSKGTKHGAFTFNGENWTRNDDVEVDINELSPRMVIANITEGAEQFIEGLDETTIDLDCDEWSGHCVMIRGWRVAYPDEAAMIEKELAEQAQALEAKKVFDAERARIAKEREQQRRQLMTSPEVQAFIRDHPQLDVKPKS